MAEWQKGGMAEWYFTTYLIYPAIFMVHAATANNDDDDTNTFKSFIVLIGLCLQEKETLVFLYVRQH